MAKTLLDGVNEALKRVKIVRGDTGALTSLTDPAVQTHIDLMIQMWNESLDDLYGDTIKPKELAESTLTLATGDRDYALQTDLVELKFPLIDETNGNYIFEWEAGYMNLVTVQNIPDSWEGLPYYAVIRPTDGELYMDRIPTAQENGRIYKYRYDKDLVLAAAADTMPFTDAVFRAMVPVVAQKFSRERKRAFNEDEFRSSLGRAAALLATTEASRTWWR